MSRAWTVLGILRRAERFLDRRGIGEPRLSAEHLLADALGCRRLELYLSHDRVLDAAEVAAYRERVRRRALHEPVQYITGRAGFRGLDLSVDRRVLVPRPETEALVAEVLTWARAEARRARAPEGGWRILDLGTGSGAIACALAVELEGTRWVLGTDRSRAALEVARSNARRAGASRARWLAADGFTGLVDRPVFDAIVSNPPYVADRDRDRLPREVAEWEPAGALFAGPGGDEAIARIAAEAPARLRPAGLLALEVGDGQAPAARRLVETAPGLAYLATWKDLAGAERGVLALARPPAG